MKETLIIGTMLFTAVLLFGGIYFPNSPLMWLASTSLWFEIIRAGLIVMLGILLFSKPPRALYLRCAFGAIALVLGIVTVMFLVTYKINLIDAVVFIEIAVIFCLEALEATEEHPIALASKQSNAHQII